MALKAQIAMVIDDDPDFTHLLATILEARKIYTMEAHSLPEAEEYLNILKPAIVFIDNSFPEGLGINFIPIIKMIDEKIKIVMITADSAAWVKEKACMENINYFIYKPFTVKMINSIIDKLEMGKM